jgi:hypothetical protein
MLRSAPGGVFVNAEGKRALNLKSCRAQPRRRELGPPLPAKLIRRRAKSSYKSESSTSASSHDNTLLVSHHPISSILYMMNFCVAPIINSMLTDLPSQTGTLISSKPYFVHSNMRRALLTYQRM